MRKCVAALLCCLSFGSGAARVPAAGTVEVLFSPWDDAEGAIVRTLGEARQSIHVQAFLLTSRSIARALQDARARGVAVEVLADREMVSKGENENAPKPLHADYSHEKRLAARQPLFMRIIRDDSPAAT